MLGLPMAFCTGSLAVIFLFVFGNGAILNMLPSRIFPFMTDYQLSAVPLFIFMAAVLEKAGIIEELFDVIYKWLGALKGGLASATVLACTLLAAMVGVVGATEVTMGMIALPAMLKRGYVNPKLGPALPINERVSFPEKLRLLRNTITPVLVILLVLGIIFFGIATPVEAAGIGTFGALVVCALHRRLTWVTLGEAGIATLKATAMVMWIFFGATMFVGF